LGNQAQTFTTQKPHNLLAVETSSVRKLLK
jgi:hypothetical protein